MSSERQSFKGLQTRGSQNNIAGSDSNENIVSGQKNIN
jgi:hypothetical protein